MRVLLPPSEAKNPGGRGRPAGARDTEDGLGPARRQVRTALGRLLTGPADVAADALLLPPAVAEQALAKNAALDRSRTTPALRRYAGVVYDGIGYADEPPDVQRVLHRDVLIFSGLLGVVRGDEPVPDYRVPAKAKLPGVGVTATFWRAHLDPLLAGPHGRRLVGRGLIIDLRSGDYAAMWRPADRDRVVTVRVLSPLPRGGHGVVSFASKLAKGRLTTALARASAAGAEPRTADDVAEAWVAAGGADARRADAPRGAALELFTA